ncbi:hypothetical protein PVAND_012565 [Polypedilum vanderplanki]|uniref:Uncharacterized protein n=1 Tax=Polypedilum vanderplanki TaxID=319348 RepID=A0A9J6CNR8_POLVA|nr:hypothetical protein PVAND_012565 [Polypedilum vanderplanki]
MIVYRPLYFILNRTKTFSLWSYRIIREKEKEYRRLYNFIEYDKKHLKWKKKFEIPSDLDDIQGQIITFGAANHQSIEYYRNKFNNKVSGIFVDIFDSVAKKANFTPYYRIYDLPNEEHKTIVHESQHPRNFSISFLKWYLKEFRTFFSNERISTLIQTPLYEEEYRLIITPPRSYNSYEKLFLPFDGTTWILLIVTFCIAFLVVMLVNNLSQRIQDIIYGENVRMPGFNTVSIFFGIGQTKIPNKFFPRTLLLLFIIFCLIFRTAYQSILFELITNDVREPLPKTINDLKKQNFTAKFLITRHNQYLQTNVYMDFKYKRKNSEFLIYKKDEFVNTYIENYQNSLIKMTFVVDLKLQSELNELCDCKNLLLAQVYHTDLVSITLPKFHYLFDLTNEVMQRLRDAGIIQHSVDFHKWILHRQIFEDPEQEPQVLTFENLSFGFVLWLGACLISFIRFCYEMIRLKLRRYMRTIIGLIYFLRLLLMRERHRMCS